VNLPISVLSTGPGTDPGAGTGGSIQVGNGSGGSLKAGQKTLVPAAVSLRTRQLYDKMFEYRNLRSWS
jgi:hypothetical protein